eukprot:GFYU01001500.1.p1 GENE.GFYU01001500.1~~GFYU01001500.1.p1  ORF type:complete len:409 (+),score=85.61 GFYU01001500.1:149-1375(+)
MAESESHLIFGFEALLVSVLLMCAIWVSYLVRTYNPRLLTESGSIVLCGMLVGGIIKLANVPKRFEESILQFPDFFFYVLLPPIIFEAGYTFKQRDFFRNMGSILLYAVVGTLISALVIGYLLYGIYPGALETRSALEFLMYGALISAVDPVATLAILGAPGIDTDPVIYNLVFGESVLNDAVSIVLFRVFGEFVDKANFGAEDAFKGVGTFFGVSVGSIAIGAAVSLSNALILKHTSLKEHPHFEIAMMGLFAYTSFVLAEITEMSGIMSLFFCGIVMAHYSDYNLSAEAKAVTGDLFKTSAIISEMFIFLYLGIVTFVHRAEEFRWDVGFIFLSVFCIFVARAANIFPMSFLANLGRKKKITFRMQILMWFSGLRGAIAFALALTFPRQARNFSSPPHWRLCCSPR